ncbi:MAG: diguanylate cyclase domain-containing protein [Fusobacteriaceae bacterium]
MKITDIQKNKFIIFFMSLIIIITLTISVKQIISRGKESATLINRGALIDISGALQDKIFLTESIGNLNYIKNKNIPIQQRALLLKPFQEKYDFLMIALMDKDGNTSSSLMGGLSNLSDREYFIESKKTKKNIVSEIVTSRTTGEKNIVVIHPLLDETNEFDGAVFISSRLNDLVKLKNIYKTEKKGYLTTILDSHLNVIVGDFNLNSPFFKNKLSEKGSDGFLFRKKNGDLHFVAFDRDNFSNWYIATDLNISKYFLEIWISTFIIIAIFIILFIMIFQMFDKNKKMEMQPLMESLKRDSLTQIYNRLYLEEEVEGYFMKNMFSDQISAFIVLDVDNFKAVNDQLGHSTGDYVIKTTASIISDIFSNNSISSRIGGDEFAVFTKKIESESDTIDKIRNVLRLMDITFGKDGINIKISASIGVTFIKNEKYEFIDLYNEADSALYKAKKSGKNCAYISNSDQIIVK